LVELFTIISLMIGLFGGSISTIIVIRATCERRVQIHLGEADEKIKEMGGSNCQKDTLTEADVYRDRIKKCLDAFQNIALIPSILFLFWIFLTSFYVSLSTDCGVLFDHSQKNNQNLEIKKQNETKEPYDAKQSSARMIINAINIQLARVLFCRLTIILITIVFAFCVSWAWRNLRRSDKQYIELEKLHRTAIREKTAQYKKT